MIKDRQLSINKLKSFFEGNMSPTILSLEDIGRIDTNTTSLWNGIVINDNNLTEIDLRNMEQSPYILLGNNITKVSLDNLIQVEVNSNGPYLNYYHNNYTYGSKILQNTKITELNLPNFKGSMHLYATGIDDSNNMQFTSFINNYWLKRVILGNEFMETSSALKFSGLWFRNAYFLTELILNYPYVIPLATRFNSTPMNSGKGRIYVPDNLVTDYINAVEWSNYGSIIVPISNLPPLGTGVYDDTISDRWETIINNCNSNKWDQYPIGGTKTVKINGVPTQMMIVARNFDNITGTANEKAGLTWIERTISRFTPQSIYDSFSETQRSYSVATSYRSIFSNIYNNIDEAALKADNGIKTVTKQAIGIVDGIEQTLTSEDKLWPPSLAEYNKRIGGGSLAFEYFKTLDIYNNPYHFGHTNIVQESNGNYIAIALRDYTLSYNNRPSFLQAKENGQASVSSSPVTAPYIIFGFCT